MFNKVAGSVPLVALCMIWSTSVRAESDDSVSLVFAGRTDSYAIKLFSDGRVESEIAGKSTASHSIAKADAAQIWSRVNSISKIDLERSYYVDSQSFEECNLEIIAENKKAIIALRHDRRLENVPQSVMDVVQSLSGLTKW